MGMWADAAVMVAPPMAAAVTAAAMTLAGARSMGVPSAWMRCRATDGRRLDGIAEFVRSD
jgi:hypothetical protein